VYTVIFHIYALTWEDARNVLRSSMCSKALTSSPVCFLELSCSAKGRKRREPNRRVPTGTLIRLHVFTFRAHFGACRPTRIPIPTPTQKHTRIFPSLYFPLHAGPHRIVGHQGMYDPEPSPHAVAYPLWSLPLSPGERYRQYVGLLRLLGRFWGIGRRCIGILILGCLLSSPSYRLLLAQVRVRDIFGRYDKR
jgi:hypothetical protein